MTSYLHKMLYALTSAYSRRDYENLEHGLPVETNIGKLFSIFSWGLDKVQEQADLIKLWDDLDYAQGKVLDRYGANFGVKRGGASDALYRLFIKVKMMAQISGGDEDTVIKAAAEFLGVEYDELKSEDVFPAKKNFYVRESLISDERMELIEQIAFAIKRTMAAGVGFKLYLESYRAFVYPLNISHGAVIHRYSSYQPVGRDIKDFSPLYINYGSFIKNRFDIFDPIGRDRMSADTLPINYGAEIANIIDKYDPIGKIRLDETHLSINHGAELSRRISTDPIGKDRSDNSSVDISRSSILSSSVESDFISDRKIFTPTYGFAVGVTTSSNTRGVPPNSRTTVVSHIKSKRID